MKSPKTLQVAVVGVGVALVLTGCADVVTVGARPHGPTSESIPSRPTSALPGTSLPLTSLPGYTPPSVSADGLSSRPLLGAQGDVSWKVYDAANQPIANYAPTDNTSWPDPANYTGIPGVLSWRGNNGRTAPTYGTANVTSKTLSIAWTHAVGAVSADGSYFPGAGWTGQPCLVNWPTATKEAMGLSAAQVSDPNFVEVIYPTFDGNVYRLDLATGATTKPAITSGWGFKGSCAIDPRGYPLLYTGQGLNQANGKTGPWEYRMFDLIKNTQIADISGTDPVSQRIDPVGWGAFDSSALISVADDTLVEPGENGVIYKVKLNSSYDPAAKTVALNPVITKMVYSTPHPYQLGIESSEVAWHNLMWATDNEGNLVCWDANTLQVLWTRPTGDDADSTPVLDVVDGVPYLYTGNSVGWRGAQRADQVTNLRKVNGLTGDVVWRHDVPTFNDFAVKGGLLSTPLLGQGEDSDMVIFNVAKTNANSEGTLLALDRESGKVIWSRELTHYSWSSPVMVHGADGHEYGVFGDSSGLLHLFDPATGRDYSTVSLGKNVEASVAAFGNMLVVASYDQKIFGVKIG